MSLPRSLPRSGAPRGIAGKIRSIAGRFSVQALKPPPRRTIGPPPPAPPIVPHVRGVAALMGRAVIPLPPKRETELPPPPRMPRPTGLAGKIPPLGKGLVKRPTSS